MTHPVRTVASLMVVFLVLVAPGARAGISPPAFVYEPLDDLADDERAGERLSSLIDLPSSRQGAYVSLAGHVRVTRGVAPDFGAMLLVQLPLDRFLARAVPASSLS